MDRHPNAKAAVAPREKLNQYITGLPEEEPLQECSLRSPVAYRGYRELLESWAALPNMRVHLIGTSVSGEPLWMFETGAPAAEKVSVVIAGIHPIEWIGIETSFALARSLSKNPSESRRTCFFPCVNPDGFRDVERNLRNGKRRWVRSNHNGVDLNRNWPTHFKQRDGLFGGHNASGTSPCSEPEVDAIVGTLNAISESARIDVALSLHSIGNMILLPWGGVWEAPEALEQHQRVATTLKERLGNYTIRQVSHWVPGISFAHGMEIDHLHKAYGATSILIECSRGELDAMQPSALLDPFRIFNPQNGRERGASIANAVEPFVRGDLQS